MDHDSKYRPAGYIRLIFCFWKVHDLLKKVLSWEWMRCCLQRCYIIAQLSRVLSH